MVLTHLFKKSTQLSKAVVQQRCIIEKSSNLLFRGNATLQFVAKRNASIHTRNFLIQKAKLEHIDNFGIFLLVSGNLFFLNLKKLTKAFNSFKYNNLSSFR